MGKRNSLNDVIKFLKPDTFRFTLGVLTTCAAEAGIYIVIAFVLKNMINAGLYSNINLLFDGVILLVVTAVISSILFIISGILLKNLATNRVMRRLRLLVFNQILHIPLSKIEEYHSGNIISRLTNDTQIIETIYDKHSRSLVYAFLYGISCLVFMFILSWQMALIFLSIGFVTYFINRLVLRGLRKINTSVQESIGARTERIVDMLSGIKVVRMFNLDRVISTYYSNYNDRAAKLSSRGARRQGLLEGINFFIGSVNFFGILAVGSIMVALKMIELGNVVAILQLGLGITFMFREITTELAKLQKSLAGSERVVDLLKIKKEEKQKNKESLQKVMSNGHYINISNLSFSYEEENPVLLDLNCHIKKNQTIAFVGPSGSGKTTLIKILLGLYPVESGSIAIAGMDINNYNLDELRKMFAYVSQDAFLFGTTIRENILFGKPGATDEEMIEAAKKAHAFDFISNLPDKFDTYVGEKGAHLSGGQKQRIAIARAFLKDAPVILLDEATSNLDSESEELIQNSLQVLLKNKTAIVVAHRLSTIKDSDFVYVISDGRIIEEGNHQSLFDKSGYYRYLYSIQFG